MCAIPTIRSGRVVVVAEVDLGQHVHPAHVGGQQARLRGAGEVAVDVVHREAALFHHPRELAAVGALPLVVERVVEEAAPLHQGAAVAHHRHRVVHDRVGRAVVLGGERRGAGVAAFDEVRREPRLVVVDRAVVGLDHRHRGPVLRPVRRGHEASAGGQPVCLDVVRQRPVLLDRVPAQRSVVGDPPEVDVVAGIHLGEDGAEAADGAETGAVEHQHLVVGAELLGADLLERLLEGPHVEADVLAHPHPVGDGLEPRGVLGVQRGVGHHEDQLGVRPQLTQGVQDVVVHLTLRVVEQVEDSAAHRHYLPREAGGVASDGEHAGMGMNRP